MHITKWYMFEEDKENFSYNVIFFKHQLKVKMTCDNISANVASLVQ